MEEFLTVTLPVVKLQQLRKHAETETQRNHISRQSISASEAQIASRITVSSEAHLRRTL